MSPLYIHRLPSLLHRKIILPTDRCWKLSKNLRTFFHSQVLLELTTAVLILEDDEGENCLGPSISFCPFHIKLQSDNTQYKLEHFNTNTMSPWLVQQPDEALMTQIKWKVNGKTLKHAVHITDLVDRLTMRQQGVPVVKQASSSLGCTRQGGASRSREV